jgi:hypothetical protein
MYTHRFNCHTCQTEGLLVFAHLVESGEICGCCEECGLVHLFERQSASSEIRRRAVGYPKVTYDVTIAELQQSQLADPIDGEFAE